MLAVPRRVTSRLALAFLMSACLFVGRTSPVTADPVPGFVEHWAGTLGNGWGGGDNYANPGTGGQMGSGDGFLMFSTPGPSPFFSKNLGANNVSTPYTGNWVAAGITQVKFWLDDVGDANPALEIHFAVGTDLNLWQYDTGFVPPSGSWAEFTVDMSPAAGWTQIINNEVGGTFLSAIENANRVLIRNDRAPFVQTPDTITADVGLDELSIIGGSSSVPLAGPSINRPVELSAPYPNPSRGDVMLSMQVFGSSPVRIEVVDAVGRMVRHARLESSGPGSRSWTWDGRTDGGSAAPAGYYRVRAFDDHGGTSRPLVRLGS
jgi:hypothetical protein